MKRSHDRTVFLYTLLSGLPALALALVLLYRQPFTTETRLTLALLLAGLWLGFAAAARGRVVRSLQTISNLLSALREGDYSIRGRGARSDDALGEVMLELNSLAKVFQDQRLGALEATALLHAVMAEIDVAVFTFDHESRLRLANRAGERLVAQPLERILGRTAEELGLAPALEGPAEVVDAAFPGGTGRWGARRGTFRQEGRPHRLLVLSDLSKTLRAEERHAWQRLIRVLSHELNNSLAPIKSVAGSLERLLDRQPRPADWEDDVKRGLSIVGGRAEALARFLQAYSVLARLPQPRLATVEVGPTVRRVAALETRVPVSVAPGPDVSIQADADQLEQLLINLVRNAADAVRETGGRVTLGWKAARGELALTVDDEGPGLPDASNLFVPFFTTKPHGSGIGLVLCRQIAEAHGGTVRLEARPGGLGARATVTLPR